MSGGGLVIGIGMLILGIAWLALPYLRAGKPESDPQNEKLRERLTLIAGYERALLTVRDLDEDFQVGKLSQSAYEAERARWVEQGAALLEAMEKAGAAPKKARRSKGRAASELPAEPVFAAPVEDPVEQAIAAYMRAREQSHAPDQARLN